MLSIARRVLWLAAAVLLVVSCSSDGEDATDETATATPVPPTPTPAPVEQAAPAPVVVMARGDWSTGWFQAEIFAQLVSELGYDVSDPAATELHPSTLYPSLARGDIDFWANGWFPYHQQFIDQAVDGDGDASERVRVIGELMTSGGVQGVLASRDWIDERNIRYLDDLAQNRTLARRFDIDGNGVADILGCDVGWVCARDLDAVIAPFGNAFEQVSGDYDAQFELARDRVDSGEPTMIFAWSPSRYVAELVPGDDMVWLGVRDPDPDRVGAATFADDGSCFADPCETGFVSADIRAVANAEFLDDHPDIATLLEVVRIDPADVAAQNAVMAAGADGAADLREQAADWIAEHRDVVDEWLESARG